jgi:unsaturated chondroitin disaccharide hydrolase
MTADHAWVETAWRRSVEKLRQTRQRVGATFPHQAADGRYDAQAPHWWTAGFWPGILWLLYEHEGDAASRVLAETLESELEPLLGTPGRLHHDFGFMWMLPAVANVRLTGRTRSQEYALLAASPGVI